MKSLLEKHLPSNIKNKLQKRIVRNVPSPAVDVIPLDNEKIKKYQFYGIMENDKFKLRDVSDDAQRKSNKSKTKGENCQTVQVDKIILYIIKILTKHDDPHFEQNLETIRHLIPQKSNTLNENLQKIDKMNLDELKKYVNEYGSEWKKMYPTDHKFTNEEYKYFALLKILNQRRKILCGFLFNLMNRYKLIF